MSDTATPVAEPREDTKRLLAVAPRPVGLLLFLAGLVHILVPEVLVRIAAVGYRLLRLRLEPKPGATQRIRVVGVAMVAAGAHLLYHGGVRPAWKREE